MQYILILIFMMRGANMAPAISAVAVGGYLTEAQCRAVGAQETKGEPAERFRCIPVASAVR